MVAPSDTHSQATQYTPSEAPSPAPPAKHVAFLDLTRQEEITPTFLDLPVPHGTTHLVLTLTYDPALDPRLPADADCTFPVLDAAVDTVTIIFKSVFMARRARSPPAGPDERAILEILFAFVGHNTTPGRRFTLVGVQELDWRWVGVPTPPMFTVNAVTAAIQDSYSPRGWTHADLRAVLKGLVFTSMGAYRSQVNDREYEENTVRRSPWREERGHWI